MYCVPKCCNLPLQGELCGLPRLSTKVVRVFTSSTFTDMLMERNVLMQFVYPKLKTYCREKHGVEFQVSIPFIIPFILHFDIKYQNLENEPCVPQKSLRTRVLFSE